jgi:DNA ligase-1
MKFQKFSEYLQKLERTPKRLEITDILQQMLTESDESEVAEVVYLSLGYLKAPYENPKFNIAEKMMLKILEYTYNANAEKVQSIYVKSGDLGDTAFELAPQNELDIEVLEVHKKLLDLAKINGAGSQEAKVQKMSSILKELDSLSAKYVVRIVLGLTRLGFTELTIIDALNKMANGSKVTKAQIELKYNVHPDIGHIAKVIKNRGLDGIRDVSIEVGVPILPQRCQRLADTEEIVEKMGCVYAEYKFDGTRVQLHMDREKMLSGNYIDQKDLFSGSNDKIFVKTFTRNLEETTHQYPDIIEAALEQIAAESVILDGEAIGYDKSTGEFLPFQEIMQRKRKHGITETAKEIPLKYFIFDILYLNGNELINRPLEERKNILSQIIKPGKVLEVDSKLETENPEELQELFEKSKEKGLEGLVIKKIDAPYQAGARAYTWVKLKRSETSLLKDTVDTVILGYYHGRGVRAGFGIGGFLAGVYDKETDTFKTVTKVGTGLKDDDFRMLKEQLDKIKVPQKPANVEANKVFEPDVWVAPKIVVELGADEVSKSTTHTAGYALRFPRLLKFRADRKPEDATLLPEIINIYQLQKRGTY